MKIIHKKFLVYLLGIQSFVFIYFLTSFNCIFFRKFHFTSKQNISNNDNDNNNNDNKSILNIPKIDIISSNKIKNLDFNYLSNNEIISESDVNESKSKSTNKNNKWEYYLLSNEDLLYSSRFGEILVSLFKLNTTYSILFKCGFILKDSKSIVFFMACKQIGVVVKGFHNMKYYEGIHNILVDKIKELIAKYEIDESDIVNLRINLIYKSIIPLSELLITDVKDLNLLNVNTKIITKGDIKSSFCIKYLPLTTNINYFGNKLVGELKEKYLNKLKQTIYFNSSLKPIYLEKHNYNSLDIFIKKIKVQEQKIKIKSLYNISY
jgi:hypothetical protein